MAKKYMEVYADAAETMYANISTTGATIVPMAAAAFAKGTQTRADFLPGPGAGKGKFDIQRRKRIKRVAADTSADAGDRFVKRLNNASKTDWETLEIVPGIKYDFLVNVEPGDAANFTTNPSAFQDGFEQSMENMIVSNEEDAIANILADPAVKKISLGDFSTGAADKQLDDLGEIIFNKLAEAETNVSQMVDEFKHMSNSVMHVSKWAAKALKAFKGSMFNVDASRYADDIVPNFTFDNSEKGLVNAHFDKFAVDQSGNAGKVDEKIIGIIMPPDSYFDSGYANNVKTYNETLLDEQITGHSYWGAAKVIDPKRIIVLTANTITDIVAKVNA